MLHLVLNTANGLSYRLKALMKYSGLIFLALNTMAFADQIKTPVPNCLLEMPGRPIQAADFCTGFSKGNTLLYLCDGSYCVARTKYVKSTREKICSESGGLPVAGGHRLPEYVSFSGDSKNEDILNSGFGKLLKDGLCRNARIKKDCDKKCVESVCGQETFSDIIKRKYNPVADSLFEGLQISNANRPLHILPTHKERIALKKFKQDLENDYSKSKRMRDGVLAAGFRFILIPEEKSEKNVFDIKENIWKSISESYPACE